MCTAQEVVMILSAAAVLNVGLENELGWTRKLGATPNLSAPSTNKP
jgi:hypothetical protein